MSSEDFVALGVPAEDATQLATALVQVRRQFKVEFAALDHMPVEPTEDITGARGRKATNGMI